MGKPSAKTFTLAQYTAITPMMHKNKKLIGENRKVKGEHIRYNYLTEEAKLLLRTILAEVYFVHEDEQCLKKITKSDIFVKNGRAEFKGVDLCKKEDTMIFQNYKEVHKIFMETVFQQNSKDIPEDVMHLLRLMTSRATAIDMKYAIYTHACLVPLENREAFFMKMYKQITKVLPEDKPTAHKKILQALPYALDWYNKLQGNSLLEELFMWKENDSRKGITCFLNSYRNATTHDMDNYCTGNGYTSDDYQLILCVTFPMLLPRMQEELEKAGHLKILKLHSMA
uniref:Uncharacterized protein n=1 Tax=Oryza barthii TaxID=65489 RepID=A0A0D3F426_9ORYZ